MSSFLGTHGTRWPLPAAVDALRDAVRQVQRPCWVWGAALAYPSLVLTLGVLSLLAGVLEGVTGAKLGLSAEVGGVSSTADFLRLVQSGLFAGDLWSSLGSSNTFTAYLFVLPVALPILLRFAAGMAAIAPPEEWRAQCVGRHVPRLGSVWRAGRGLTRSALGLWLSLQFLFASALLVLCYPIALVIGWLDLDSVPDALWILIGPIFLVLASYGTTLLVLNHLALQSLARNRRGAGSALIHAWRLVRGDPWASMRALAMDLLLTVCVLFLQTLVENLVPVLGAVLVIALLGFSGAARAAFWARAYRALGGLSAADGVPGLLPLPETTSVRTGV